MENIAKPRFSPGARTDCDVNPHPEDITAMQLGKSFRTVGTGNPEITILDKARQKKYPCLFKAIFRHEEKHVANIAANCKRFKKCVDENSSKSCGFSGNLTFHTKILLLVTIPITEEIRVIVSKMSSPLMRLALRRQSLY
ncbi:hypothetical protein CEE37_12315 [candidate division LCP-89 bacterium B3_LCP]|uniref:Uncharacterized protein n=1 Tax=candidate division LCP-89 bacterium B3_LCP TaxID=2012998 RepID=A0A532UUC0_UNCL8|nr:MAG: hypothetical protein CEE37_12315 [candidate division LCP-89 bacterium B3_LCP]